MANQHPNLSLVGNPRRARAGPDRHIARCATAARSPGIFDPRSFRPRRPQSWSARSRNTRQDYSSNASLLSRRSPTQHRPAELSTALIDRFPFRFDWRFRVAATPLGITPNHAFVEVDHAARVPTFSARFGLWQLSTPIANVVGASRTGPYSLIKTIGPPHVSLADQGLTFATNNEAGVCIRFAEPVAAIEPLGLLRHPSLTVTVGEIDRLVTALDHGRRAASQ